MIFSPMVFQVETSNTFEICPGQKFETKRRTDGRMDVLTGQYECGFSIIIVNSFVLLSHTEENIQIKALRNE
jgi:hypothetical protein